MSTTGRQQCESNARPRLTKRRSLGLSRKWLSPAASATSAAPLNSPADGQSPNTSRQTMSRPIGINESPKSASNVPTNSTPNRLVSRYSNPRKRHFKATFKSPMKYVESGGAPGEQGLEDVQQEITNLNKQIQLMTEEEDELRKGGFMEEELQVHIDKLHEYNELKDTGQMLIGKIATLEGRTTKEMYEQFGLDLED